MMHILRRGRKNRHDIQQLLGFLFNVLTLLSLRNPGMRCSADDFQPWVLHGGLVTAVAGRDFTILATDTRMIGESGYNILERNHISSRIWGVVSTSSPSLSQLLIAPDGSLSAHHDESHDRQTKNIEIDGSNASMKPFQLIAESIVSADSSIPILVGSAGMQGDCEQLKRDVRADVRAARYFGDSSSPLSPDQAAVLLSNTLYSRRNFPYYAFCVLAGMGKVFVYDAIGSYEQVAVACTGSGRELLQPILDRKFRATAVTNKFNASGIEVGRIRQRPASTQVDCPRAEDALSILLSAYRSVSEREIQVGDHVVFCVMERCSDGDSVEAQIRIRVWKADLKKH
jgi:20S proteasome subunit beta 6